MPPSTRVLSNRYEIGAEIGRGGMADVYLGHDRLLDRRVAVKVLSHVHSSDPASVERFRREAQAAAGLNHPNIVAVYDWGQEGNTSFIVMEYVPGQTLRELLRAYGRLAPTEAARIAAEIADALSFAHRGGVVHRDVKPGNVLITREGQVKVADFGIARAESGDGLTQTGAIMGTATYFSPEQAQGLALDGRSDVYALGVVLYEMVTGVAPFVADSPVSVAFKHVHDEPVPPSEVVSDIPGAMDRIVLTAMAKDVTRRYQSAADLRGDLLRFERHRPLMGGPGGVAAARVPSGTADATMASPSVAAVSPAAYRNLAPAPRRWGPIITVGLAFVSLVVLVAALLLTTDISGNKAVSTKVVANFVGLPYGQVNAVLVKQGFHVIRVDDAAPGQPADQVLSQRPVAGSKLEKGGTVTVTVSSADVTMPNVVGQTREAAQAAIAAVHLNPIFNEVDSDKPPGTVLSTNPAAGAKVLKTTPDVQIQVAKEPPVPVPDVANQDSTAAAALLGQKGFQVQAVPTPSDTVPVNKVIGTDPAAGTPEPKGTTIRLLVSSGPDQVDVPNVVGQTKAAAEATLLAAGFNVNESNVIAGPTKIGKVVTQSPLGATKAKKGDVVNITIGI
jgi:beta-lactam-binding protein with PASTA domain